MQPDPELERRCQARIGRLFTEAPAPDADRLEAGLEAVRRAGARQRGHRLAWIAGAALVAGAVTATAAWWIAREPTNPATEPGDAPTRPEPNRPREEQPRPAPAEGRTDEGTGHDGPLIYRRAE